MVTNKMGSQTKNRALVVWSINLSMKIIMTMVKYVLQNEKKQQHRPPWTTVSSRAPLGKGGGGGVKKMVKKFHKGTRNRNLLLRFIK